MSEFKFACPVCGQHITADGRSSGSQIECPTCFQKLVVPQTPGGNGSKLILTAAKANGRRTTSVDSASQGVALPGASRSKAIPLAVAFLVLVFVVGGAVFAFRDKIFKSASSSANSGAARADKNTAATAQPAKLDTNWTLNLADTTFPEAPVAGKVHGHDFNCERAVVQNGILSLRQGRGSPPDLEVAIFFFTRQSETLSGQTANIVPGQSPRSPRVQLKWKEDQPSAKTQSFNGGYAMKLELGPLVNSNRMSGKIYLCLPDDAKSYVAGTFDAEVKKNTPPKPKAPKKPKPPAQTPKV